MPDSSVPEKNLPGFCAAFAHEVNMYVLLHGDAAAMQSHRAGILSVSDYGGAVNLVCANDLTRLVRSACRVLRDEHAALKAGMSLTESHLGALGFAAATGPDGLSAVRLFEELQALCMSGIRWRHVRQGNSLEISAKPEGPPVGDYALWSFLLGFRLNFMRRSCGRHLVPLHIDLPCAAPHGGRHAVLDEFVGAPIRFGASQYRETYPLAALYEPNRYSAPEICRIMTALARREHDEITDINERWMARLKSAVFEALEQGRRPTLGLLCSQFDVQASARQVQRRLGAMRSSFRELVAEVRRERTLLQLRATSRPFADIAAEAGYSELSSFHRAVRRWTGLTPLCIRSEAQRRGEG